MEEASIEQTLESINTFDPKPFVSFLCQYARENGFALAIWRSPQTNSIHWQLDKSGGQPLAELQLSELKKGFVVHPFQVSQDQKPYFFKEDIGGQLENLREKGIKATFYHQNTPETEEIIRRFHNVKDDASFKWYGRESTPSATPQEYTDIVAKSVQAIQKDTFTKIVPARSKTFPLPKDFQIGNAYVEACLKYQQAFISLFTSPHTGTWMGATPELLISEDPSGYFRTVALAGTKAFEEHKALSDTAWTQKEIEEQALVSRYIINCFKKIRLREYHEVGPRTIKAGNLLHLKTDYSVDIQAVHFPDLSSIMLSLLHPTSAVCGMPKVPALEFLKKEEGLDRKFYAGFLGPVHQQSGHQLYVNLRCCNIENEHVTFFAGAGITADSDPVKELRETDLKIETIKSVILG